MLLAACSAAPTPALVPVTITLENNICTYDGPQPIPAGAEINTNWVVKDTDHPAYSVMAIYLVSGKTLEDARATIVGSGSGIGILETAGGAEVPAGGGTKMFQVRTTKGPLYFVCVTDPISENLQFIGPFEVEGTSP